MIQIMGWLAIFVVGLLVIPDILQGIRLIMARYRQEQPQKMKLGIIPESVRKHITEQETARRRALLEHSGFTAGPDGMHYHRWGECIHYIPDVVIQEAPVAHWAQLVQYLLVFKEHLEKYEQDYRQANTK